VMSRLLFGLFLSTVLRNKFRAPIHMRYPRHLAVRQK